jgi:hypothetical protein
LPIPDSRLASLSLPQEEPERAARELQEEMKALRARIEEQERAAMREVADAGALVPIGERDLATFLRLTSVSDSGATDQDSFGRFENDNEGARARAHDDTGAFNTLLRNAVLAEAEFEADSSTGAGEEVDDGSLGFGDFGGAARQIVNALRIEAREQAKSGGIAVEVKRGRRVATHGGKALYEFRTFVTEFFPPETPVTLVTPATEPLSGHVVSSEENEILVEIAADVGDLIPRAVLRSDVSFVNKAMASRLEESLTKVPLSESILGGLFGTSAPLDETEHQDQNANRRFASPLNTQQQQATDGCLTRRLFFVWGPPGTGKTRVLGHAVNDLALRGESVLVIATANAAVDVAMLRVRSLMIDSDLLASGRVLRVGTPSSKEARDAVELSPDTVVERKHPELIQKRSDLLDERSHLTNQLRRAQPEHREQLQKELKTVRTELQRVEAEIRKARAEIINDAMIIGCTFARLATDSAVWERGYDVTCVDEASMASFGYVFVSALRARKRLLIFGDFRQLPAVHHSNNSEVRNWLGKDAFEMSGVRDAFERRGSHRSAAMLTEQYRMASPIAETVSELAYGGRLTTWREIAKRTGTIAGRGPAPGTEIVVLDTSRIGSVCSRGSGYLAASRRNLFHALTTTAVAGSLRSSGRDLRVLSPYRAQTETLARLAREFLSDEVKASTIHRFQGGEAAGIVFDLVDAPPENRPSGLTGDDPELSLRLLNVSVSRAMEKCVIVADLEFLRNIHPVTSPGHNLVEIAAARGTVVDAIDYLPTIRTDWIEFLDFESAQEAMSDDLNNCIDGPIQVFIPKGLALSPRFTRAIHDAASRMDVTICCDLASALAFEDSEADVRLQPVDEGFTLLSPSLLWAGGTAATLVARLTPRSAPTYMAPRTRARILQKLMSAELSRMMCGIAGRCPECGAQRSVRARGGTLIATCSDDSRHPVADLADAEVTALLERIELRCPDCGGPVRPTKTTIGFRYICSRKPETCGDDIPAIEDLFPE